MLFINIINIHVVIDLYLKMFAYCQDSLICLILA